MSSPHIASDSRINSTSGRRWLGGHVASKGFQMVLDVFSTLRKSAPGSANGLQLPRGGRLYFRRVTGDDHSAIATTAAIARKTLVVVDLLPLPEGGVRGRCVSEEGRPSSWPSSWEGVCRSAGRVNHEREAVRPILFLQLLADCTLPAPSRPLEKLED